MNSSDSQQKDQVITNQSWSLGLELSNRLADGQFLWEWWLQLHVSDAISVTPAVFIYLTPLEQNTAAGESFSRLGALVKTTFRFLSRSPLGRSY